MSRRYYDARGDDLDPTPRPRKRWGYFTEDHKAGTIADALVFCNERGLDPADVRLMQGYCDWQDVETAEEVQQRIEAAAESRKSHLAAIREMYEDYESRGLLHRPAAEGDNE